MEKDKVKPKALFSLRTKREYIIEQDEVTGRVKWFDELKGYGMIIPDVGEKDIFVHFSSISGNGYRVLKEGQDVIFTLVKTSSGRQAFNVRNADFAEDGAEKDKESKFDASVFEGTVKWFSQRKRWGFITAEGIGSDIFVHFSSIHGHGRRVLVKGEQVKFLLKRSDRGPQAFDVQKVNS